MEIESRYLIRFIRDLRSMIEFVGFNIILEEPIPNDFVNTSIDTIMSNLLIYMQLKHNGFIDNLFNKRDTIRKFDILSDVMNDIKYLDLTIENHRDLKGYFLSLREHSKKTMKVRSYYG